MGKKRINIAFKRYDLTYKNHQYCVLIPEHIDQLWVTNAGTPHWGVNFKMREKRCKTMQQMPWVLYYDLRFERLTSKLRDK